MRLASNQVLLISAAGILVVGVGLAANIAGTAPAQQGPDTAALQALAARLEGQPLSDTPELRGPTGSMTRVTATPKRDGGTRVAARKPAPPMAAPKPPPAPVTSPAATAAAARAEAVKNIALTGVTDGSGQSLAWFVDISNNDRQTAEKGAAAFGFTVKEIRPDSVLLTSGSDEFVVRMGDKQIPSVVAASYESPESAGPGGFGPGGFGPGGFGGRGDRGDRGGDFMQRIADFRSRFGGGGFGGGSFGGGRSWGGGDSGGRSWGGGGDSSRSSSTSNGGRSRGGGGFSGFGGGFGGGFSGGFGSRGNSSRSTQTAAATSNPQTARRSGGRLVSGATALPTPQPISNPQTQRRTGSTTGQAFGDESANSSRSGFNNGSTRTSSFGNRGR
jgi:hypothetical protein